MDTSQTHMLFAVYADRVTAEAAVQTLSRMKKEGQIELDGAAVVAKDFTGHVTFDERGDLSGRQGLGRGALVGTVVGLIFPPSIIGAAVLGAGLGGLAARLRDRGFSSDALRQVGERLDPGQGAVVAIARGSLADQVVESLQGYQKLFRQPLDPHLVAAADEHESASP